MALKQRLEEEGASHVHRLDSKPDRDSMTREYYEPISVMKMDTKC